MKKEFEENTNLENQDQFISIVPIEVDSRSEVTKKALLELQVLMATSSINHEYARLEYNDADCPERKEELLEYMNECRTQYFKAREDLERYNPYSLKDFEEDLIRQKQAMTTTYHA